MKTQVCVKAKSSVRQQAKSPWRKPPSKKSGNAWTAWLEHLTEQGVDVAEMLTAISDESLANDDSANNAATETVEETTTPEIIPVLKDIPAPESISAPETTTSETTTSETTSEEISETTIPKTTASEATIESVQPSPVATEETYLNELEETEAPPELANSAWFQSKAQCATIPPEHPPDEASQSLDQILSDHPTTPLPFQPLLESRLGHPLNHIDVYAGTPEVRSLLAEMDAQAAHYDQKILLADPHPPLEIITHEVIHALQATPGQATPPPIILSPSAPTEQEAEQLTQEIVSSIQSASPADVFLPWTPVVVNSALHPNNIACLREAPATVSAAATPRAALAARTEPDQPVTSAPEPISTPTPETSEEQAETEAALESGRSAPVGSEELDQVPALAVPAPPEPGITAEDVAARAAELAAAEAALSNATDADEKVDAYAMAPPTLKAQSYGSLGSDVDALTKAENESFQAEMPDFQAKLSGETDEPPDIAVEAPPAETVSLEEGTPAPAPDPEVAPTAEATDYTRNDSLLRAVSRFSEGTSSQDRASEIGDTLSDVQTTDSEVDTSPGPAPAVPLEGETDPERIENQLMAGRDRATQSRDQAQQSVLEGPGPEQIQPLVMAEAIPLEALEQPVVTQPEAVSGIDEFSQREMPAEVHTAFDLTHQEPMQASMAEAQTSVQEATAQRDRDRTEQVNTAQAEADRQTMAADTDQRNEVQTRREGIQAERQQTLNDQRDAVQSVESDAETRRQRDRDAIDGRVRADQETIRTDYAQAERDSQAEVRDGERQAEEAKNEAEREAESQSWWDRAVNFVKEAFQALTDAISAVFDAVRAAINTILDAVKDAAIALIDQAANFIKNAINEFSEFLQSAVTALLQDRFPELAANLNGFIANTAQLATEAVDAVAEDLKSGITALVEGLRAGLNAVLDALQAGLEFASSLIQAALSGDWGAVLKMLIEAVLRVIGIEPETFYQFMGEAQDTFQKILDDPGAVVSNLVDAMKLGIQKFADNFLEHLQTGIIGWLTGALGGDLEIPTEFTLIGVLDLARQIMGLTMAFIRRVAVRLLGEENVERIETIIEQVQNLISGGWTGLLEQITESLTNVKEMVIGQIKEFLVTRLILAAITKLATLFNPVGAIVQLVLTIWNIFNFLKENLERMAQIVQTIVASISPIVAGVIDGAASSIETVLANLLPVAISFLANLLGLSGLGRRVSQIIERLRERIENAIMNFIRRIAARLRQGRRGRETQEEDVASDRRTDAQKLTAVRQAVDEVERIQNNENSTPERVRAAFPDIQRQHQLTSITLVQDRANTFHVLAVINPRLETQPKTYVARFRLAPGGFENHENIVIVAATEESDAQTVHMISRHGADVPDEALIGRIDDLRTRFREERQRRIEELQHKISELHIAVGGQIGGTFDSRDKIRRLSEARNTANDEIARLSEDESRKLREAQQLLTRLSDRTVPGEEKRGIRENLNNIEASVSTLARSQARLENQIRTLRENISLVERRSGELHDAEVSLNDLRQMNATNADMMRTQMERWNIRNIPEKATRFRTTDIMFDSVRDVLNDNAERIDDTFGRENQVGARLTLRQSVQNRSLIGVGFELSSSHRVQAVNPSDLDQIVVVVRLIDPENKFYVVETAYPT